MGAGSGITPLMTDRSERQTPVAAILILSSPAFGASSCTSSTEYFAASV